MRHIIQMWHEDGVPADMPMFVTEGNLSSGASETYQDIFSGLWLADYIGSLLDAGGKAVYYFHYLPLQMEPGCNSSPGTFGMFTVDASYKIQQPLAQFFVAQLINLEWAQPGGGEHQVYSAKSDVDDGAGRELVTAYALKRPDGDMVADDCESRSGERSPCSHRVSWDWRFDREICWSSRDCDLWERPIQVEPAAHSLYGACRNSRCADDRGLHKRHG